MSSFVNRSIKCYLIKLNTLITVCFSFYTISLSQMHFTILCRFSITHSEKDTNNWTTTYTVLTHYFKTIHSTASSDLPANQYHEGDKRQWNLLVKIFLSLTVKTAFNQTLGDSLPARLVMHTGTYLTDKTILR
jgi:hypothetical protein